MFILQTSLFSFEELLKVEPENRLTNVLSTLNFEPILKELQNVRGPKGRNKAAMLRAMVAMRLEGIPNVAKLWKDSKGTLFLDTTVVFGLLNKPLMNLPLVDY